MSRGSDSGSEFDSGVSDSEEVAPPPPEMKERKTSGSRRKKVKKKKGSRVQAVVIESPTPSVSATRGVEVVVRSGSELLMMRQAARESSYPTVQTKPRSLTTVEDAMVHVAAENPRMPALKRLNRRSLDLGHGEDKVSFKRGTGDAQDEVWTLSRKKLDALRTLSSSSMASSGSSETNRSRRASAKLPHKELMQHNRSMSSSGLRGRSQTRLAAVQQKSASNPADVPLLSKMELSRLTRTLSDPLITASMVAAIDEERSLNDWTMEGGRGGGGDGSTSPSKSPSRSPRTQISPRETHVEPKSRALAKILLQNLAHEMKKTVPDTDQLSAAFARRDARVKREFEAARMNPLHHLEASAIGMDVPRADRRRTVKLNQSRSDAAQKEMIAKTPKANVVKLEADVEAQNRAGGRKVIVRKDCTLEFDPEEERYMLKFATCDRMLVSLVDRFLETDTTGSGGALSNANTLKASARMEKKAQKQRNNGVTQTARSFCIGALKLWPAVQVLETMLRLRNDLMAHAEKMQGTGWAASSDLQYLEQLVRVWMGSCFPRCVRDSPTLQAFTALVSGMPHREEIEDEIVALSQANSRVLTGQERRKLSKKKTLGSFFTPSARPIPTDFMQIDVLDIPAADIALELTRVTLTLMRAIPVDMLVRADLSVSPEATKEAKSAMDLPPLFVLRSRTERLSHWTVSVVVGEKLLARRIGLFSKMVAIAARLVDMRNLHDAVAMVTALHNPALSRLKQTISGAGETVNRAFAKLTDLIRPPYKNLRRKQQQWQDSDTHAFLPPLEVLLQDMNKLDEVEKNFVPHPQNPELRLGNIWKTNLLGSWVSSFVSGFQGRAFDFEGEAQSQRSVVLSSFVKVLPDVFDDDTLWEMSKKLETSAQGVH